jgi:hypothetical protein
VIPDVTFSGNAIDLWPSGSRILNCRELVFSSLAQASRMKKEQIKEERGRTRKNLMKKRARSKEPMKRTVVVKRREQNRTEDEARREERREQNRTE